MSDFFTWLFVSLGILFTFSAPYLLLYFISGMAKEKASRHWQILMDIKDQDSEIQKGKEEIQKSELELLKDEANYNPNELSLLQTRLDELLDARDNIQDRNDELRAKLINR